MIKIKTSDLTDPALDWAVELALGTHWSENGYFCYAPHQASYPFSRKPLHNYSTDWAQAGPIIEREKIAIDYDHDVWNAAKYGLNWYVGGPTPLIAAMRCFVASKLGDEVDVPEELL